MCSSNVNSILNCMAVGTAQQLQEQEEADVELKVTWDKAEEEAEVEVEKAWDEIEDEWFEFGTDFLIF